METIFRKVLPAERLPTQTGRYHTNRGLTNYFHEGLKYPPKGFEYSIDYWLEEIELPDGEAVANGCMEHLKAVGMVENRHIIAHDWQTGVSWLHQYITGEK